MEQDVLIHFGIYSKQRTNVSSHILVEFVSVDDLETSELASDMGGNARCSSVSMKKIRSTNIPCSISVFLRILRIVLADILLEFIVIIHNKGHTILE